MSSYFESYQNLGEGADSPHTTSLQEALLLQAWSEFWRDVMENACPPPDSARVLVTVRYALQCARSLRHGLAADRQALEAALAEAIQIQTEAVLRWCDTRGTMLPEHLMPFSMTVRVPPNSLPLGLPLSKV